MENFTVHEHFYPTYLGNISKLVVITVYVTMTNNRTALMYICGNDPNDEHYSNGL